MFHVDDIDRTKDGVTQFVNQKVDQRTLDVDSGVDGRWELWVYECHWHTNGRDGLRDG